MADRLRELTAENEALRRENETLKCENEKLRAKNDRLKRSLDDTTKSSKALKKQVDEANARAELQRPACPDTTDPAPDTVDKLQRKLSQTSKRLSDYRKRLSDMQERMAVIEQVTIVTQKRELHEDDYYNALLQDSVYENLFHVSAQMTSRAAGAYFRHVSFMRHFRKKMCGPSLHPMCGPPNRSYATHRDKGVDLCKKCGWVQTPQSAGEMKILHSAVTKQCLLKQAL